MLQRAVSAVGGGGGTPEWILDATVSGSTFSASWDYDAETIIMLLTTNASISVILMYNVATKALWDADTLYNKWTYYGIDNRVTITSRSISGTFSGNTLSAVSIIPIANKPNGYFT